MRRSKRSHLLSLVLYLRLQEARNIQIVTFPLPHASPRRSQCPRRVLGEHASKTSSLFGEISNKVPPRAENNKIRKNKLQQNAPVESGGKQRSSKVPDSNNAVHL